MINILVLCDDFWHPAEVVKKGLKPLSGDRYKFEFVMDAKDILTPDMIKQYPLIMNCKGNCLTSGNQASWFEEGVTEVMPQDFMEYVKNGGGFLSVHSGNTSKENDPYTDFIGNFFVTHPPRCDVEIKITGKHPVTEGVKDFTIRDEHYEIVVTAEDAQQLFQTLSETGGVQTGGYIREIGKGRICVLTPGHILSVWHHREFQKLLINAIDWCVGRI